MSILFSLITSFKNKTVTKNVDGAIVSTPVSRPLLQTSPYLQDRKKKDYE
jgi:hypothetical protein